MNNAEPIRRNARIAPDAPAYLRVDGSTVSYAVLDATVDALAHRLRDLSLVPGQTAAIGTNDWYRYMVVMLALARIGVAAAPVTLPAALTDIAIAEQPLADHGYPRVVLLDDLWPGDLLAGGPPPPAASHTDCSAILAYCPSSGTTAGTPKFVALSHDLNMRRIAARALSAPVIASARAVCLVAPSSVFGLGRTLRTLWSGCVVVEPNLDAQQLASWLISSQVTHMAISPTGLRKILEVLPADGITCALETVEVGGGVLPLTTLDLAQRRLPANLIATYGATETGPVAAGPMAAMLGRPDAVGYPFPGVEVEIVDDDDRPVERGQEGTLRVRSGHIANAYVGNDAASARVFRGGWVYPNDRAILEHDGLVRILGRTDDVINQGGVKSNPQAIEDVLMTLADLREVAVFGAPRGERVVLCAAIVPNVPLVAADFHTRCRERLGAQAPAFIMQVPHLPRNAMGKVLRNELARMVVEATRGSSVDFQRVPLMPPPR